MAKAFRVIFTAVAAFFLAFFMLLFPSKPGVDCIAGCTQGVGFPFDAYTISSGGISSSPTNLIDVVFPFIKTIKEIYIVGFFADLFIAALIIVLIYKFLAWLDRKLF